MNLDRFGKFQALAGNAGLLFYYRGSFTPLVVETVGEQLRSRLDSEGVSAPVKRKLFSTFVEMAQNIMHYGLPEGEADAVTGQGDGSPSKSGALALGVDEDGADSETGATPAPSGRHWIVCGNLVRVADVPVLSQKLDALRAMTAEEIKASYKRQLLNDEHSAQDTTSKGAGLGLLTIARDSKAPLEFSFESDPASAGQRAYFFVKAVI